MPKFRDEAQKTNQEVKQMPRCEIIANVGQNLVNDKGRGLALIQAAYQAKAQAIIFSRWSDKLISEDWLLEFKRLADDLSLDFIGEPKSTGDVDQFERLNVTRYKVDYRDIRVENLLNRLRMTGKPILLSVGVATYPEIEEAIRTLRPQGEFGTVTLLHKVFHGEEANLRAILDLKEEFGIKYGCAVGLESDLLEWQCDLIVLTYGVSVIEKKLDIVTDVRGGDWQTSLENSDTFSFFSYYVRQIEKSLDYRKFFTDREVGLRRDRDE